MRHDIQNPQLVAKCEQILCATSCEQQSQNLLLKVDRLCTIRNNKLIMQGKQLETSAKLRGFVSNYYIVAAFKTTIYEIRVFCFSYFVAFRTLRNKFILICSARFVDCMCSKKI